MSDNNNNDNNKDPQQVGTKCYLFSVKDFKFQGYINSKKEYKELKQSNGNYQIEHHIDDDHLTPKSCAETVKKLATKKNDETYYFGMTDYDFKKKGDVKCFYSSDNPITTSNTEHKCGTGVHEGFVVGHSGWVNLDGDNANKVSVYKGKKQSDKADTSSWLSSPYLYVGIVVALIIFITIVVVVVIVMYRKNKKNKQQPPMMSQYPTNTPAATYSNIPRG